MSDKMTVLYYALWITHPVLQMGIATLMFRRGLHRKFKFFFGYILIQLITFAVIFPATWYSNSASFYLYWVFDALSVAFGFAVIHEVFVDVFRFGDYSVDAIEIRSGDGTWTTSSWAAGDQPTAVHLGRAVFDGRFSDLELRDLVSLPGEPGRLVDVLLSGPSPCVLEGALRHRSGSTIPVEVIVALVSLPDGVRQLVATVDDLRPRKQLERNLATAEEAYFAANAAYTGTLSNLTGFKQSPGVSISAVPNGTVFTASASHSSGNKTFDWNSANGGLQNAP